MTATGTPITIYIRRIRSSQSPRLQRWRMIIRPALFAVVMLVAGNAIPLQAQDATPTPTPDSDEVRRLKEEKAQSELRKGIAEDQKAEREAKFPKPTATPLEGKTEVDSGVKLESEMLAYRSMRIAADRMVADMKSNVNTISAMAIHNDHDLKALLGYMVLTGQLQLLRQEYEKNITGPPPPSTEGETLGHTRFIDPITGIAAAQSILGSFIDLIALLRTDTKVTGMEFNIEESALVSELFRAVRAGTGYGAGTKLFYPAVFPPKIGVDTKFIILKRIQELHLIKERAAELVAEIEATEKALGETKNKIGALENRLAANSETIPLLDKELERLQKLYWRWPLTRIAERIEEVNAHIQQLRDENQKVPIAIKQANDQLEVLTKRLEELYGEILPNPPGDDVLAAINTAIRKIFTAEALLGRRFTELELGLLFTQFSDGQSKALVAEAERFKGTKLTDAEKRQLLTPLSSAEKTSLIKISASQSASGVTISSSVLDGLPRAAKLDVLSQADRTLLLPDTQQTALRKLKEDSLTRLRALNDQVDKLKAELIKVDEGAGLNALTSYLQAENLLRALECNLADGTDIPSGCTNSYIVQLKVVRAGGNNKITRNLLKDVFMAPSLSHSGGAIVQYSLYDITGQSKSSNIYTIYSSYINAKKLADFVNQN